jgi:hypothetical protein
LHGFHKKGNVIARRAFCARRSNPLAVKEIASGWKEHPALAMTQSFIDLSTNYVKALGVLDVLCLPT